MSGTWFVLIACCVFVGADVLVFYRVWFTSFSPYAVRNFITTMIGVNGRYGYDAQVPWGGLVFGWIAVGILSKMNDGTAFANAIIPIFIPALFAIFLLNLSLLLFLRPRLLVPPHLRDKRGWIPEWWANRKARAEAGKRR